ncbi:uncharacterized protein LOC144644831 [Oculina patagonica]
MKRLCFVVVACLLLASFGFCLKCYYCNPQPTIQKEQSFTPQQCEKNQTEVACGPNFDRCLKAHQKKKMKDGNDIEHEMRGCSNEKYCNWWQKRFEQAEMFGWDFELACCQSELCNTGDIAASEGLTWLISVLSCALLMTLK